MVPGGSAELRGSPPSQRRKMKLRTVALFVCPDRASVHVIATPAGPPLAEPWSHFLTYVPDTYGTPVITTGALSVQLGGALPAEPEPSRPPTGLITVAVA